MRARARVTCMRRSTVTMRSARDEDDDPENPLGSDKVRCESVRVSYSELFTSMLLVATLIHFTEPRRPFRCASPRRASCGLSGRLTIKLRRPFRKIERSCPHALIFAALLFIRSQPRLSLLSTVSSMPLLSASSS